MSDTNKFRCGTTHHLGCDCHEARHAAEVARLQQKILDQDHELAAAYEQRDTLAERVRVLEEAFKAWRDLAHIQNAGKSQTGYGDWLGYQARLEAATVRAVDAEEAAIAAKGEMPKPAPDGLAEAATRLKEYLNTYEIYERVSNEELDSLLMDLEAALRGKEGA